MHGTLTSGDNTLGGEQDAEQWSLQGSVVWLKGCRWRVKHTRELLRERELTLSWSAWLICFCCSLVFSLQHRDVNHMLADKHANKRGHTRPDFMASDSPQAHAPPAEAFGHSGGAAEGAADKALEQEASGSPADVTDRALLAGTEQPEAKVTQAKH